MNRKGTSTTLIFLAFFLLCICGCDKPYHRIQASRITDAVHAMGPAGNRSALVQTPDGIRVRTEINFRDRKITDDDLVHLKSLDGIVGLDLSETDVTDKGMEILVTLPDLEYLQLADTKITDAGLSTLKSSNKLSKLDLRRTKISKNGVAILQNIPSLRLVYSKGTLVKSIPGIKVNTKDDLEPYWRPVEKVIPSDQKTRTNGKIFGS